MPVTGGKTVGLNRDDRDRGNETENKKHFDDSKGGLRPLEGLRGPSDSTLL